ncbi:MAG: type II toxin-antitoxin system RatA family toxin [Pseudomonadota bacterium]
MTTHTERKHVPHTPEQMFDLVADIEAYPVFIPWCTGMRLRSDDVSDGRGRRVADMMVRFKVFRERFTTQVDVRKPERAIDVAYIDGPFRYLTNRWRFEEEADGSCTVDFYIDFKFKNPLLQAAISQVFDEAIHKLVTAFVTRANALYPENLSPKGAIGAG